MRSPLSFLPVRAALVLALAALAVAFSACSKSQSEKSDESAEGGENATCGRKGLPDCPLQEWMKNNLKAALEKSDTAKLASALDTLAKNPPAGFTGWDKTATAGADAARRGDIPAVKAECKTCHDEQRSHFKKEVAIRTSFSPK